MFDILIKLVKIPFDTMRSITFEIGTFRFDLLTVFCCFMIIGVFITVFLRVPSDKGGKD